MKPNNLKLQKKKSSKSDRPARWVAVETGGSHGSKAWPLCSKSHGFEREPWLQVKALSQL